MVTRSLLFSLIVVLLVADRITKAASDPQGSHRYKAVVGDDLPNKDEKKPLHHLPLDNGAHHIDFFDVDPSKGKFHGFHSSVPVHCIGDRQFPIPVTDCDEDIFPNKDHSKWDDFDICYDQSLIITMCQEPNATYDVEYAWKLEWKPQVPPCYDADLCSNITVNVADYLKFCRVPKKVNFKISGAFDILNPECCDVTLKSLSVKVGKIAINPDKVHCSSGYPKVPGSDKLHCTFSDSFPDLCEQPLGRLTIKAETDPTCECRVGGDTFQKCLDWELDQTKGECASVTVTGTMTGTTDVLIPPSITTINVCNPALPIPPINFKILVLDKDEHVATFTTTVTTELDTHTYTNNLKICGEKPFALHIFFGLVLANYTDTYKWVLEEKPPVSCIPGALCFSQNVTVTDYFDLTRSKESSNYLLSAPLTISNPACIAAHITGALVHFGSDVKPVTILCNGQPLVGMTIVGHETLECTLYGQFATNPGNGMSITIDTDTEEVKGGTVGTSYGWTVLEVNKCVSVKVEATSIPSANITISPTTLTLPAPICTDVVPPMQVRMRITTPKQLTVVFTVTLTSADHQVVLTDTFHIPFCGTLPGPLVVNMGPSTPTYDQQYTWTFVNKSDATCISGELCEDNGIQFRLTDYFGLTRTMAKVNWTIAGMFTINNPTCMAAILKSIDVTVGDTVMQVWCEEVTSIPGWTLPGGETLTCHYSKLLGDSGPALGALKVVVQVFNPDEVTGVSYNSLVTDHFEFTPELYLPHTTTGSCVPLIQASYLPIPNYINLHISIDPTEITQICDNRPPWQLSEVITVKATTKWNGNVPVVFTITFNGNTYQIPLVLCSIQQPPMSITAFPPSLSRTTGFDWKITLNATGPSQCINSTNGVGSTCLTGYLSLQHVERAPGQGSGLTWNIFGEFVVKNNALYCNAVFRAEVRIGSTTVEALCTDSLIAPNSSVVCNYTFSLLAKPTDEIVITVQQALGSLIAGTSVNVTIGEFPPAPPDHTQNYCVWLGVKLADAFVFCANETTVPCINVTETQLSPTEESCFDYLVKAWEYVPKDQQPKEVAAALKAIRVCYCPPIHGCVFTMGYWRHHCCKWPPGYANKPFFKSCHTWEQAINHIKAPRICYWKLAQQWIAAQLNIANGASHNTPELNVALNALADYFLHFDDNYHKAECCDLQQEAYYHLLAHYNEGILEVPLCCPVDA